MCQILIQIIQIKLTLSQKCFSYFSFLSFAVIWNVWESHRPSTDLDCKAVWIPSVIIWQSFSKRNNRDQTLASHHQSYLHSHTQLCPSSKQGGPMSTSKLPSCERTVHNLIGCIIKSTRSRHHTTGYFMQGINKHAHAGSSKEYGPGKSNRQANAETIKIYMECRIAD